MKIISVNFNGIRSAASKGFFDWLAKQKADIVCGQEIKAQDADLTDDMRHPKGFTGNFHCAEKKGYSGVALYTRPKPDSVVAGLGIADIDAEGRYLRADYGNLSVISLYLPSGSSGEERQQIKFAFLDHFYPVMKQLKQSGREIIICGDWNIAHKEIDLKNWKSNQKNSGFLPEERAWLSKVFDELGYVDVFRTLDQRPEQYTWWSNRGQAWAKNVGWRLDYQLATPGIAATAKKTSIYLDERFSDHAPLTIEYDYKI
jgi:exodeoxyribonuclease III